MPYWEAVAAIKAANLRANTYRTARELLDLAAETGQLKISKPGLAALGQTESYDTMRRQLGEIQRAGIIHFSTNEVVHISFIDYPTADGVITTRAPMITSCTPVITTRANVSQDDAAGEDSEPYDGSVVITTRAPVITTRAPVITSCTPPHTRVVSLLVSSDPTTQSREKNKLTNKLPRRRREHEPEEAGNEPLSDEQVRAVALLTDPEVGVTASQARQIAADHDLDYIARQVFEWRRQLDAGVVLGLGALFQRFRGDFSAVLIPADRASPLWRRHMAGPDETIDPNGDSEAERRRRYIPDEYSDIIIG
jgi:hypothetical protein